MAKSKFEDAPGGYAELNKNTWPLFIYYIKEFVLFSSVMHTKITPTDFLRLNYTISILFRHRFFFANCFFVFKELKAKEKTVTCITYGLRVYTVRYHSIDRDRCP